MITSIGVFAHGSIITDVGSRGAAQGYIAGPPVLVTLEPRRTVLTTGVVPMLLADGVVNLCATIPAPVEFDLLDAALAVRAVVVKDRMGSLGQGGASGAIIIIKAFGSQLIDGFSTATITIDGASITLLPVPTSDPHYPGWTIA